MHKRKLFLLPIVFCCGFSATVLVGLACDSIMYPTVDNVRTLNEANLDYQQGLQESTVETMTDQHGRMSPENQEWFDAMLAQNAQFVSELKDVAVSKAAVVSGPEIGNLGGAEGGIVEWGFNLVGLGWLIPFWNMFFGKSRGTKDIVNLKDEISALKLKLATAAKTGADMPSDTK